MLFQLECFLVWRHLVEMSSELRDDPDDGKSHTGQQSHFPRLADHEVEQETETSRVPHQETQLLAQCFAHVVGVRGNTGHKLTWDKTEVTVQHECKFSIAIKLHYCSLIISNATLRLIWNLQRIL